jgi:hypothetical protein
LLDPPLSSLSRLCGVDVVDVVALQAVRQSGEEGPSGSIDFECRLEIVRDLDFSGTLGDRQCDSNVVVPLQTGGLADSGAHADHVFSAHHPDGASVLVAVHFDEDLWATACPQRGHLFRGHDDACVVARLLNRCFEGH